MLCERVESVSWKGRDFPEALLCRCLQNQGKSRLSGWDGPERE